MLTSSARREISKEEGAMPLIPSSAMLRVYLWLKLCERRRQTAPNDDIIQNVVAAAVCFVVVVHARLHCTTSSMWLK